MSRSNEVVLGITPAGTNRTEVSEDLLQNLFSQLVDDVSRLESLSDLRPPSPHELMIQNLTQFITNQKEQINSLEHTRKCLRDQLNLLSLINNALVGRNDSLSQDVQELRGAVIPAINLICTQELKIQELRQRLTLQQSGPAHEIKYQKRKNNDTDGISVKRQRSQSPDKTETPLSSMHFLTQSRSSSLSSDSCNTSLSSHLGEKFAPS